MRSATDDHAQPSHPSLNGTEQETTITVDGQAITDSSELAGVILTHAPGTTSTVGVTRGTAHLPPSVILGQRPAQ